MKTLILAAIRVLAEARCSKPYGISAQWELIPSQVTGIRLLTLGLLGLVTYRRAARAPYHRRGSRGFQRFVFQR
jgi:hypothetical protein